MQRSASVLHQATRANQHECWLNLCRPIDSARRGRCRNFRCIPVSCTHFTTPWPPARSPDCGTMQRFFDHGLKVPISQRTLLLQVRANGSQTVGMHSFT